MLKRSTLCGFVGIFLVAFSPVLSKARDKVNGSKTAASPATHLDQLFKVASQDFDQGIVVVRIADAKVLYAHNDLQLFNPASTAKLITSAAVLDYFGPNHQFNTKIYHSGQRLGGKISGDLIIVGDGDPLFVSETLWQMAADLQHLGLESIEGDLVIDNSLFADQARQGLRLEGEKASQHAYDAAVTPFGVNFNTVALAVAPSEQVGALAHVNLDPLPIAGIEIENQVRTSGPKPKLALEVTRVSLPQGKSKILLRGEIPLASSVTKVYRSVNDPVHSSGELVRAFLAKQGIRVQGRVRAASCPPSATLLWTVNSQALRSIIASLNQYSSNYIADVMIKRLGAASSPRLNARETATGSGSYASGLAAMDDFLRKKVGLSGEYQLENGSGLSTANRISAGQLVRVLQYVASHWEFFPDYLASLPVAGESGTLDARFRSKDTAALQGQIRAKTGTLSQPVLVSALAGYTQHHRHGLVAFAILQNGKPGPQRLSMADLHALQEKGLLGLQKYL